MSDSHDELDTGPPVTELQLLRETPRPGFGARIQRAIGRRRFAGQLLDFGLTAPMNVFLEYLKVLFEGLLPGTRQGGPR